MENIINGLIDDNKNAYEQLSDKWADFSNNLRKEMEVFLKEHEEELKIFHETYKEQVKGVNHRIAKILNTINTDYQKMFQSYIDRTTSFQESLGLFTPYRSGSLFNEVNELKNSIKYLEDKINKIDKGKKSK
jgi:hypothetical protein